MTVLGKPLLYKEETSSTMEDALEAHREGYPPGTVCWTSNQTQGRGRLPGRVWESRPGEALMLTALLDGQSLKLTPTLSLRIGLAVARYLEKKHHLEIQIKWPNDIYSSGKKLCGILCEYREEAVLAGLGLNLNQETFPDDLPRAGSLYQITGYRYPASGELPLLLEELKGCLKETPPLEEWNRRLLFRDKKITILVGDPGKKEELTGILKGIQTDGALRIALSPGEKAEKVIYSGELII